MKQDEGKTRELIFEGMGRVAGAACQICGKRGIGIRISDETGAWCKRHFLDGMPCMHEGCYEPVMRIVDGGDGMNCRAHNMPNRLSQAERSGYGLMGGSKKSALADIGNGGGSNFNFGRRRR